MEILILIFVLVARPGTITAVLVSLQAIPVFEAEKNIFAHHVKSEPPCQSFSISLYFSFNQILTPF